MNVAGADHARRRIVQELELYAAKLKILRNHEKSLRKKERFVSPEDQWKRTVNCPDCGRQMLKKSMNRHKQIFCSFRQNKKIYTCICGSVLSSELALEQHKQKYCVRREQRNESPQRRAWTDDADGKGDGSSSLNDDTRMGTSIILPLPNIIRRQVLRGAACGG